jgi:hypothetical protein
MLNYFLLISENSRGFEGCKLACKLLSRLSLRSSGARSLALRTLLELALFHGPTYLIGGNILVHEDGLPVEESEIRLMDENLKQVC